MTRDPLRVVRLDLPLDDSFDRLLAAQPAVALRVCATRNDDARTWDALAQAHVYHVSSSRDELPQHWFVRAPLLERCPDLLCVSTYGAGYDTVDVAACTRAGVCVVNQAGSNAGAVAEHAFGLMLGLMRRIPECDGRLRRGGHFTRHDFMGEDLHGRTLGLVGIGHAGRRMAALAQAFGMTVLAADPLLPDGEIARRGAEAVSLEGLLRRSDVVSLHCPLDDTTRGMMDARAFARMKPGAVFITTARGGIHDEAALHEALRCGHLGGAGLDVWSVEPPPPSHPLLQLDRVLATCHIAGVSREARRRMAGMAAGQILGVRRGERPARLVNPEVWARVLRRLEGLG
jgi:D-3-phosphoglycerate dehydrogenase